MASGINTEAAALYFRIGSSNRFRKK